MHGYETPTAPAEAAALPTVESDPVGPAAPVQHGDFAAGLRACPHDADACGTFATGMSASFTAVARTIGDFATGNRASSGARVLGDFATGTRARDASRSRSDAGERPRSGRERRGAHWATA